MVTSKIRGNSSERKKIMRTNLNKNDLQFVITYKSYCDFQRKEKLITIYIIYNTHIVFLCVCVCVRGRESPWLSAKVLDCDIIVNPLEIQLRYCLDFWTNISGKGMNLFMPPDLKTKKANLTYHLLVFNSTKTLTSVQSACALEDTDYISEEE